MMPDYPVEFWILAAIAVLAVGIGKTGFGGGVGSLATPLMSLVIPVASAAAIMLPLLVISDLFAVYHYRSMFHKRNIILMLPGAMFGITAGAFCFWNFIGNERILQIIIGGISVAFVVFQYLRALIFKIVEGRRPKDIEGFFAGVASGFTSTLAHAGGPPATIFLLSQKMPKELFVGTTVIFFAITNFIKLIPYYFLGLLNTGQLTTIFILAPLSLIGVKLGISLNRVVPEVWFNRLIYTLLLLTGIQLIIGKSPISIIFG
jgi:uncharacterized membrane protein YfcA